MLCCITQQAVERVVDKNAIEVGDIVLTVYATCKVKEIRSDSDCMHVLEPVRWVLADKKPPKFYMQADQLQLYQKVMYPIDDDGPFFFCILLFEGIIHTFIH